MDSKSENQLDIAKLQKSQVCNITYCKICNKFFTDNTVCEHLSKMYYDKNPY